MKLSTLNKAVTEAERFIERANALRQASIASRAAADPRWRGDPSELFGANPREQGATKRASMDLTRTLADLRAAR